MDSEVTHRMIETGGIRLQVALGRLRWYRAAEVRSEQKLSNPRSGRDREGRSRRIPSWARESINGRL